VRSVECFLKVLFVFLRPDRTLPFYASIWYAICTEPISYVLHAAHGLLWYNVF
jgi:hypothetical protein